MQGMGAYRGGLLCRSDVMMKKTLFLTQKICMMKRKLFLPVLLLVILVTQGYVENNNRSIVHGQTPLIVTAPSLAINPLTITLPGQPAVKLFLPLRHHYLSHAKVSGGGVIYWAKTWCVEVDSVVPTLDFGCDMNIPANPAVESKIGWPPQILSFDFVLPRGWFLSVVDPIKFANSGIAIPTTGSVGDQIGVFAPSRVHTVGQNKKDVGHNTNAINIFTFQAFARCDFQAYYHVHLKKESIILDQKQTTHNCRTRFPPLIQL